MIRVPVFVGAAVASAVLAALAAGCTTQAGSPASTGRSPAAVATAPATATGNPAASPPGSFEQQALAWGRRFAQCARDHGVTNFPDPIYHPDWEDSAGIDFPVTDKGVLVRAQDACLDILRQMPPRPLADHRHDAQRLAQMREYAACMRQHGVSDFPDPTAYGTFPLLGTRLKVFAPGYIQNLPPDLDRAYEACWTKQHDWRMVSLIS